MTTSAVQSATGLSIGEVLAALRPDFPDVTISKIRFLEAEGLVRPYRTPSGYRKFATQHVQRLRYVLHAQRDRYLPLKVIREHLDAIDHGLSPADGDARYAMSLVPDGDLAADGVANRSPVRLSREQLLDAAEIDEGMLGQLESFGLVRRAATGRYDVDALHVAKTAGELKTFGFEPRHLRAFKAAADREVGLIEQVVTPLRRLRSADAQARAEETQRELADLSVRLHAALVASALAGSTSR